MAHSLNQEDFQRLQHQILACAKCTRLRAYCADVAATKKKAYRSESYHGKPVPGFGDVRAEMLIVGLAPAAHGANRTGRMFTGDNSGVWLYRALFKAGFASQAESISKTDGLFLKNTYLTTAVKCAPPGNKPSGEEFKTCASFLSAEVHALKNIRVVVALGQLALKSFWKTIPESVKPIDHVPKFFHGNEIELKNKVRLICSYHPSQQNTFTKVLTEPMFDSIFKKAKFFLQNP